MQKVNAFYDKEQVPPIVPQPGFYAVPIEVDEWVLELSMRLRELFVNTLVVRHATGSFPRGAQEMADKLTEELREMFDV